MKLTVFCGSRAGNDKVYSDEMRKLWEWIAKGWHILIYGGSSSGLMGSVALSTLEAGGKVVGIFPLEPVLTGETGDLRHENFQYVEVKDMQERKKELVKKADVVILAPGGWGSMDEVFEVLTLNQIGVTKLHVAILNTNGYYDPLITLFESMFQSGFVAETHRKWFFSANDAHSLLKLIENI